MKQYLIFSLFFSLSFINCKNNGEQQRPANYYKVEAVGTTGINMVIEIPAGTNHKIEYDPNTDSFINDVEDGKDRVISFLPYPGNYGFIPSTLMDKSRGGDGDALDILVIGETEKIGTVLAVQPIGALLLLDNGEIDTKLIAIPSEPAKQVISPKSFQDFIIQHDAVRMIIENWFLNYKGQGKMELIGWRDDTFALREIEKWKK